MPAWKRGTPCQSPCGAALLRAWSRTQPRPRSELRELLESLDGQHVELQPYADKFGHVEWWVGTLDATHIGRGVVEFTYAAGERKTVMLSAIGYVIDGRGQRYGPF